MAELQEFSPWDGSPEEFPENEDDLKTLYNVLDSLARDRVIALFKEMKKEGYSLERTRDLFNKVYEEMIVESIMDS